jgi:hypothetical protein
VPTPDCALPQPPNRRGGRNDTIWAVAERQRRQALVGRLAALGWFTQDGEVAATQAVGMLLEEPPLREALLRHLSEVTATDLSSVTSFQAELVHDDLARPDLEGRDGHGRPLLVIEAKFGARLTGAQLQAYTTYLEARLEGGIYGALIVLVPSYRGPEAQAILDTLEIRSVEPDGAAPAVTTTVLTWDDLLGVLDAATQGGAHDEDGIRCDLRQLRALCRTMAALDIPPLGLVATGGGGVQDREADLQRLIDEATSGFRLPSGRLLPLALEREFDYYRRYIPGGLPDSDCYCSVGVLGGLADPGTPFWLRYHRDTGSYQAVASRIMASRYASDARGDGGHTWLPLRVSADRSGVGLVDELLGQIEAIRTVAAGGESL